MAQATLRADDRAILGALAEGPLTANEIASRIRREARARWLAERGIHSEPEKGVGLSLVKLLAHTEARQAGLKLLSWEVDGRLRVLERRGAVARIQIEGRKPMLWRSRV